MVAEHEINKRYNNKDILNEKHRLQAKKSIENYIVYGWFSTSDMCKYLIHVSAINYIAHGKSITLAINNISKDRNGALIVIDGLILVINKFASLYLAQTHRLGILFNAKAAELLEFKNDRLVPLMGDSTIKNFEIMLYLEQLLLERQKAYGKQGKVVPLTDHSLHWAAMSCIKMGAYRTSKDYRMQQLVNNVTRNDNGGRFNGYNNRFNRFNNRNNNSFNNNNSGGNASYYNNNNFGNDPTFKKRKLNDNSAVADNNNNSNRNYNNNNFYNNGNNRMRKNSKRSGSNNFNSNANANFNTNNTFKPMVITNPGNNNNNFNPNSISNNPNTNYNNNNNNQNFEINTSGHPIWNNHIKIRENNWTNPRNPNNSQSFQKNNNNNFKDNQYLFPGISIKDICKHWNNNTCNRPNCRFMHICSGCGSRGHSKIDCNAVHFN